MVDPTFGKAAKEWTCGHPSWCDHSMDTAKSGVSEREQHGLRGTVKTCLEERFYSGGTSSDGTRYPETRLRYTTEYDENGRTLLRSSRNSDGSHWITRYTYDA